MSGVRTLPVVVLAALLLTGACSGDEETPDALPAVTPTSDQPTDAAEPSGTAASGPAPAASSTAAPVASATRASTVGRYVVTAGDVLRLHDPATGKVVRTLQETPQGAVDSDVELSRDGASVYALREYGGFASCGRTQVVSVATSGGPVRALVELPTRISQFAVAPDRRTLAYETADCTTSRNAVLVLKDLGTGTERRVPLPDDDERSQNGLAFAPDSRHLFVDGRVVDATRSDPLDGAVLVDVPERLAYGAQYRPDGRLVLTTGELADADSPQTLVAVDDTTGRPVGSARTLPRQVFAVSYGPSGQLLGLQFPEEGDDFVAGALVRLDGASAVPVGGVQAVAMDWT